MSRLDRTVTGASSLAAVLLMLTLGGFTPPAAAADEVSHGRRDAPRDDPFEAINRPIFAVNDTFDRLALRPIAWTYDKVVPSFARRGVGNFFANLQDVTSACNAVLQWRWPGAAQSSGRFVVNSTLGLAGLFDVASPMGIDRQRADFGQTLARWGVPRGPYLMLPLLGPRTARSGVGALADTFAFSIVPHIENNSLRNALWGTELVHGRSRLLESDRLIFGDRYIFVRDAYLQQRANFVNGGEAGDDFSDFDTEWEEEF